MNKRIYMLGLAPAAPLLGNSAHAQPQKTVSGATEAALRDTIAQFEIAWNKHDVNACLSFMPEDIWSTQTVDTYGRMKGKQAIRSALKYDVKNTDLKWEIQRVRMMPDGTASVVLRQVGLIPPKTDGKYKREDVSEPSFSRWRFEGGGWKLFFFTSHKGWAIDQMKKDGLE